MVDRVSPTDQVHHVRQVHWRWTPILALLFWAPWSVVLLFERIPLGVGFVLLLVMFLSIAWMVDAHIRAPLGANFRRLATFHRVHAEAKSSSQPIALLLRSFSRVHSYHDWQTGFSIFWLLDEALRETGLQPVLLGTDASLPDNHGTLMFPTENDNWQEVFETFADAAAVIVVIPELTESLQTEMRMLRERGWLAKSIAVMTPASVRVLNVMMEPGVSLGGDDQARSDRWEVAREHLSLQGLKLPPYDTEGALVEWSATGDIYATSRLSFEPSSFYESFPFSLQRRRSFVRCWRALQTRRRYNGKSISETYLPIAPVMPAVSIRGVLNPPGCDSSLRDGMQLLVFIGWAPPLALLFLNFLI